MNLKTMANFNLAERLSSSVNEESSIIHLVYIASYLLASTLVSHPLLWVLFCGCSSVGANTLFCIQPSSHPRQQHSLPSTLSIITYNTNLISTYRAIGQTKHARIVIPFTFQKLRMFNV